MFGQFIIWKASDGGGICSSEQNSDIYDTCFEYLKYFVPFTSMSVFNFIIYWNSICKCHHPFSKPKIKPIQTDTELYEYWIEAPNMNKIGGS